MLTYLTYLSTLYFNLGEIIGGYYSFLWDIDTLVLDLQ